MLGIPLRYLTRHPIAAVSDLAADPIQTWMTIRDVFVAKLEQRGSQCHYESDENCRSGFMSLSEFRNRPPRLRSFGAYGHR